MNLPPRLPLMLLALVLTAPAFSQEGAKGEPRYMGQFRPECGDPRYESSAWTSVGGVVIDVLDGGTLLLASDKDHTRVLVHLAAIAAPDLGTPQGKAAQKALADFALNERAKIATRSSFRDTNDLVGIVSVAGDDLNFKMIELGLVRYRDPEPYSMSNYAACHYRAIAQKARNERRGIWNE